MSWHPEALPAPVLEVLRKLGEGALPRHFYLAGGTGLALRLGHRISVDLDFFTREIVESRGLAETLRKSIPLELVSEAEGTLHVKVEDTPVSRVPIMHKRSVLFDNFSVVTRSNGLLILLLLPWLISVALAGQDPATEAPDVSPETRAEQRRQLREEKLANLQPPQRNQILRAMVWFEEKGREKVENFNFKRFFPKFGGLPTGSGFGFGSRYWNPRLRGSPWDLQASGVTSTQGYQLVDLQFGQVDQPEKSLTAFVDLRYRDFPQEDFFGLGPDSLEGNRSDYRLNDAFVGATLRYRRYRFFQGELRAGYLRVRARRGTDERFPDAQDLFDPAEIPGLSDRTDYFTWSASALADFRDAPGAAHTGGSVRVTVKRYDDIDDNLFDFTKVQADVDYYVPLWSSGRTLALRYFTSLDAEDGGDDIPFYLQNTLGGSEMLRGFREFRFRDRNLIYLSAEYRWEAMPALEFAVFYDAGKVFADRADYDFTDLEGAGGIGLRIKTRDSVVFRIDAARSHEGARIYFKFGGAF